MCGDCCVRCVQARVVRCFFFILLDFQESADIIFLSASDDSVKSAWTSTRGW